MPRDKVVRRRLADGTMREYRYRRGAVSPTSVSAAITRFMASPAYRGLAPSTRVVYDRMLDRIDEQYGPSTFAGIQRRHIVAHRDQYADTPGAANNLVTAWGALFSWAVDAGLAPSSPVARIKRLVLGEHRRWADVEVDRALASASEHVRRAILLLLYTGQRRGDAVAMTWSAFDGAGITVRPEKLRRKRQTLYIPVHATLRAELAAWRSEPTAAVTILTNSRGKPWTGNALQKAIRAHLDRIGLHDLCPHGLRKAAASRLAEAGCTAFEVAAITGHMSLTEVERYTRAASQREIARAAVVKLEQGANRFPEGFGKRKTQTEK